MRYSVFLLLLFLFLAACGGSAGAQPAATPAATLGPQAALGQSVFSRSCAACHSTFPGTTIVGPSLAGIAVTAETRVEGQDALTYLYSSILQPGDFLVDGYDDLMPAALGKQLTGEQLDAVVAYLMTLE